MGGQQNKTHKQRFASKGEQHRRSQGRVERMTKVMNQGIKLQTAGSNPGTKSKRYEAGVAKRTEKRKSLLHERRIGTAHGPPKIVAFLGLSSQVDPHMMREAVADMAQSRAQMDDHTKAKLGLTDSMEEASRIGSTHLYPEYSKTRMTLISTGADLDRQLDAIKVADNVVLVIRAASDETISQATTRKSRRGSVQVMPEDDITMDRDDELETGSFIETETNEFGMCIDEIGQKFLSIMHAMGLPSVTVAVVGMKDLPTHKLQRQMTRLHTVFFRDYFPFGCKIIMADDKKGLAEVVRHVATTGIKPIQWREEMPYMLVDNANWDGDLLSISGYLRGKALSANQLAHITHFGTFPIHSIEYSRDPCPLKKLDPTLPKVVDTPTEERDSMAWCKEVDHMANEQTWPTEDDLEAPEASGDVDSDDENMLDDRSDTRSVATSKSRKTVYTEIQTQIDSLMATEIQRLEDMDPEQRERELKYFQEQRRAALMGAKDDRAFPDELETPAHIPARNRFLRYRGMSSFKSSKWDPYESLPLDYARVFQFANIKATKKRVLEAFEDHKVQPDGYITIRIENMPKEAFNAAYVKLKAANGFLTFSGMRRHEQKWSIMHYNVQFSQHYKQPIKSKEHVLMHVGFRIMRANPIYSENNQRGDKTKFMRYFQPEDKFAVASIYGPISYPPSPVLLFKAPELGASAADLVSWGSVMGADPNRIILKKVVLSAQPFRIHKKQAVCRFMFYNEKDVNWFKPIELFTKYGQVGHIKQALGTHGYMKCQFNEVLRADDAVMMALYKRVYPKWTTIPCSWLPEVEQMYNTLSLEDQVQGVGGAIEDTMTPTDAAVE